MKIFLRAKNGYLNTLHELDLTTRELAKRTEDTSLQFEGRYREAKKKCDDHLHQTLYAGVGLLLAFLFLYQNLGNIFVDIFFAFYLICIGLMIWRYLSTRKMFLIVKKEWDNEFALNEELAKKATSLKKQAASLAFNIIIFSENYEVLMNYQSLDERKNHYHILFKEYLDAFQLQHHNQGTFEDVLAYYLEWESRIESPKE